MIYVHHNLKFVASRLNSIKHYYPFPVMGIYGLVTGVFNEKLQTMQNKSIHY